MKDYNHHIGISFNKKTQKWHAYFDYADRRKYLKLWFSKEKAIEVRENYIKNNALIKYMKRSGFARLTYAEAQEKQEKAHARKLLKPKPKKAVKYPTVLGIKATRYTGLKGVLWAIFSMYIRKRDFILHNGRCVSCSGILNDWKEGDAGHYVSVTRGNFATLFDERNVHLQCKRCNNPEWTPDASIPYSYELDRRCGKGTADKIYKLSDMYAGSYSELEYMREIEKYKEKFAKL